jgi:hypothetical protein
MLIIHRVVEQLRHRVLHLELHKQSLERITLIQILKRIITVIVAGHHLSANQQINSGVMHCGVEFSRFEGLSEEVGVEHVTRCEPGFVVGVESAGVDVVDEEIHGHGAWTDPVADGYDVGAAVQEGVCEAGGVGAKERFVDVVGVSAVDDYGCYGALGELALGCVSEGGDRVEGAVLT